MREFKIKDEYIKLGQLLKAAGLAENGVIAKKMILEGKAYVNGEVDLRRGRKVCPGDIVSCEGEEIKVI